MPKRLALIESFFRETNERAGERVLLLRGGEEVFGITCECADLECRDKIVIPKVEYQKVRRHPTRFIVRPGHVVAEVERTVSRGRDFDIVSKRGIAGKLAASVHAV